MQPSFFLLVRQKNKQLSGTSYVLRAELSYSAVHLILDLTPAFEYFFFSIVISLVIHLLILGSLTFPYLFGFITIVAPPPLFPPQPRQTF